MADAARQHSVTVRPRWRCGRLLLVMTAVTAAAVGLSLPNATATPATHAAHVPSSLLTQHLSWAECYPGQGYPQLKCAKVTVPIDWAHPLGATISIEVSRIKAAEPAKRRGVLFTNPGGPGEEGLDLPLFIPETDPSIAAAFDLIGIDQRGVGESEPLLQCAHPAILTKLYNLDGRDTSRRNQGAIETLDRKYATECSSDPLTRYIQHSQTVQDFDLIRQLLHESKINYLGFSGGTQLGAWYASVFPQHAGRFVLDGNIDWTSLTYKSFNRQPHGFQNSFDNFLEPWLAGYNHLYRLGRTRSAVDATYERRRAALARHPATLEDGSTLTAAGYDSGIISALYVTSDYPDIAEALSALEHYATATAAEKDLVAEMFSSSTNGDDPFWAIVCQDDRSQSYPALIAETNYFRKHDPLMGADWNANPCPFFTLPVTGSPVRGDTLPKLLMLNNDADPATPLRNAQIARSRTPNARLVTVRHEPEHTIYGYGDDCADGYANAWLLTGVLPTHDVSCPGVPLPAPTAYTTSQTSDAQVAAARGATPGRLTAELWVRKFQADHGEPATR